MAERGTFLGEVQVAAKSAGRRFWALPWKYKGSAMGVAAVVLIGAATAGGGEDSSAKNAFQASADASAARSCCDRSSASRSASSNANALMSCAEDSSAAANTAPSATQD